MEILLIILIAVYASCVLYFVRRLHDIRKEQADLWRALASDLDRIKKLDKLNKHADKKLSHKNKRG